MINPAASCRSSSRGVLGQVPIYYNHQPTGRPCDVSQKWNSRYRDLPLLRPAVPVRVRPELHDVLRSNLRLSKARVAKNGTRHGVGGRHEHRRGTGDDVVQLYIHDPVASISQPVRRLRGFQRVTLEPGATRNVSFTLDRSDFGFYDNDGNLVVEPGEIEVYAGDTSTADMTKSFTVQ